MSTLTLQTTPKHLPFYRRLFRGGAGYWGLTQQDISDESSRRMDSLTGCPDEVLLGIAEISTLSCWKIQELRKGSLSMRELIRRGDVIERHLRTQTETVLSVEADQTQLHPDLSSAGTELGNIQGSPTGHESVSLPMDDTRRLVADIFRETAVLYLHTILSDPNPGESKLAPESVRYSCAHHRSARNQNISRHCGAIVEPAARIEYRPLFDLPHMPGWVSHGRSHETRVSESTIARATRWLWQHQPGSESHGNSVAERGQSRRTS
jgi:hypothetical protein